MNARPAQKDAFDVEVGQRLRQRRVELGFSQDKLAQAVGVSFQQIQKYENGTNRIAGGRLTQMATALGTSVGWLLEGLGFTPAPALTVAEGALKEFDDEHLTSPETLMLLKLYYSLTADEREALVKQFKLALDKKTDGHR